MAIRLHRCPLTFIKSEGHGCWRVQQALEEAGVEYDVVKVPLLRPRRKAVEELSGQRMVPVLEFEDGTAYRAESAEMAERIREGKLGTTAGAAGG